MLFAALMLFVAPASGTCVSSNCTNAALDCNTCQTDVTHTIFQKFNVPFVCSPFGCKPNFGGGNTSQSTIEAECRVRTSTCCVPDDGPTVNNSTCETKTCLVNNGCVAVGQCEIPNTSNYRSDRSNCCFSDSGCPQTPTTCAFEACIANTCTPQLRFNGCCDTSAANCTLPTTAVCLRAACLPDPFNPGFGQCTFGLDKNCPCTSGLDCDDGLDCSVNTCDVLSLRCRSTFFSTSGGSSCCGSDATATTTCSTGDPCRNILGCNSEEVVVNASLTVLPQFTCIARQENDIGCCSSSSLECTALQTSTMSPCVAPSCDFGQNQCAINPNYFSSQTNETLPCCFDSVDCEPTGEDADRCTFLRCRSPLFQTPLPTTFFTCARETVPACVASGVITTNAAVSAPALGGAAGNCTWTCGAAGSNTIRTLASVTNPSSGANAFSPLYRYNLTVVVTALSPVLQGIVSSIGLVPQSPYFPPTRTLNPALFTIAKLPSEIAGVYRQEFALTGPMPIYPDETLTVLVTVVLRINATLLTSLSVRLILEPFDICTQALIAGMTAGIDGTPCSSNAHLGNILPRTVVQGAPLVIGFPAQCPVPCSTLPPPVTETKPTQPITTAPTTVPTTATTPGPTFVEDVPPGGRVFFDLDENGFTNEATEPAVPNVRISMYASGNLSEIASTTSDALGIYRFSLIPTFEYYLLAVNASLPYGYRPTIIPGQPGPARRNLFDAVTLETPPLIISAFGIDLGLVKVPPCDRRVPPSGPTGGLLVEFDTARTNCVACSSLINLRSRCTPTRCAGLMTRHFLTVEATVSNTGALPLGFNTLLLRLNSLGVGPTPADLRPYVCAEAFDAGGIVGARVLDSFVSSSSSLASIAYGWQTMAVGSNLVRVRTQFLYCAHDAITHFNVTAEIYDSSCIARIRAWNLCDQTIDIRTCQATQAAAVPPCFGCPPTVAPSAPTPAPTSPPSRLNLNVQPYCFDPLCVNTAVFAELGCTNVTAAEAQCSAALNRGQVLHQVTVSNPSSAPTASETGYVFVEYRRQSVGGEHLLCGDQFGDNMPVFVMLEATTPPPPYANATAAAAIVDRREDPLTQSISFNVLLPSLPPGSVLIISLVSFECSAHPLSASVAARLDTDRCRDETLCYKVSPPMESLDSPPCVRYSSTGCTETIGGVRQAGLGIEAEREGSTDDFALPYFIVSVLLCAIIGVCCILLLVLRRRRMQATMLLAKRMAASRSTARAADAPLVYRQHVAQRR